MNHHRQHQENVEWALRQLETDLRIINDSRCQEWLNKLRQTQDFHAQRVTEDEHKAELESRITTLHADNEALAAGLTEAQAHNAALQDALAAATAPGGDGPDEGDGGQNGDQVLEPGSALTTDQSTGLTSDPIPALTGDQVTL